MLDNVKFLHDYFAVCKADVTLTTLGQNTQDNIVLLCPGDDYVFVFQCIVRGSHQFQWSLRPLLNQLQFGQNNKIGKHRTESQEVTLILTEKEVTPERLHYESQLQVSTGTLIEHLHNQNQLKVVCETLTDSQNIIIHMSGKSLIGINV